MLLDIFGESIIEIIYREWLKTTDRLLLQDSLPRQSPWRVYLRSVNCVYDRSYDDRLWGDSITNYDRYEQARVPTRICSDIDPRRYPWLVNHARGLLMDAPTDRNIPAFPSVTYIQLYATGGNPIRGMWPAVECLDVVSSPKTRSSVVLDLSMWPSLTSLSINPDTVVCNWDAIRATLQFFRATYNTSTAPEGYFPRCETVKIAADCDASTWLDWMMVQAPVITNLSLIGIIPCIPFPKLRSLCGSHALCDNVLANMPMLTEICASMHEVSIPVRHWPPLLERLQIFTFGGCDEMDSMLAAWIPYFPATAVITVRGYVYDARRRWFA